MSVSASLNITLASRDNQPLSSRKIIDSLLNSEWCLVNNNKIYYLPLGDDDDFDWQENQITKDNFFEIVKQKEDTKEIIGVGLTWANTDIGVILLIHTNYQLSFSLTVNRKKLQGNITNFNWYLEKILPCFETSFMTVENFSFGQD